MPVELNLVESVTELDTTVVTVVLESASEPGPAGPGVPVGGTAGQVLTKDSGTDYDTSWQDSTGGPGAVAAEDVGFTPAGNLAATDVQAALEELDTEKAATTHAHAGEDITSGTVADARIASTIARDTEVTAAISAHESDTTNVHGIADTSVLATDSEVATAVSDHNSDTTSVHGIADTSALLDTADIGVSVQAFDADLSTYAGITPSANVQAILGAANYAAIRTLLTLVVGTNVQAWDADLDTYAGITPSANAQSLLAAANYAAMRALLDLEAGTDFPSLTTFNDHSARHENGGADEISVAGLSGELADAQPVAVHKNGTIVGTRSNINFIEGTNVTLTIADDSGDDEVDVTIAASGSGSGAMSFIPTFFAGG